MAETSCRCDLTGVARLKLFWALSRTPHGLLDMCTAALASLLWLGHFPSFKIIGLGLITVFSGYTAIYALNDVVGYRSDKRKLQQGNQRGFEDCEDLDAMLVRHPMARGLLSFKAGLLWSIAWALLALIGAYLLNPVCVLIFICGSILEIIYCLMWNISPSRTLISGVVKTAGPIAAVFAVDPNPSISYLMVLFLLMFFWEIGGQNVPNDWSDIEEDIRFQAQTGPIRLGLEQANVIIFGSIILTIILSGILLVLSNVAFELPFILAFAFVGLYFLLLPTIKLYRSEESFRAMILFNKASYYPLALLVVIVIKLLI
ncbi:MAG: UbiA family prenyltransferase [Desulfobacterales bacterium]|jgi:4-hydroxybenzoate polyprenyltransferase